MTTESLVATTEKLQALTHLIQDTMQAQAGGDRPPARVFAVYLASFFQSNLDQGGFAQLLYNARGENLAEMNDMLYLASATHALESYLQAVSLCLDDLEGYQAFLASDFVSPSDVKNGLHLVSIEYFQKNSSFLAEAAAFVDQSEPIVRAWADKAARPAV